MATVKPETVKEAASREEVILKKPHTHGSKPCDIKDKIMVTEAQKAWLTKREII